MAATDGAHFDFIVVGGGTAGNTAASRLAKNPSVTTLVVEAGVGNPDEAYKTTFVKRDDYERIDKPNTRGKVLGGSSSLNYFTWAPGCKSTFDLWEEYGGKEWTWDPLKIGTDGSIHISHAELIDDMNPFREAVTKAWKSRGEPQTSNVYDGEMNGLTRCADTIYKGVRSGSYLFLKNKRNITVLPEVLSKRLIIDDVDRTCKGVTVIAASGKELNFYASREVILSQGVFKSPKPLMLSGIGPARELAQHGIDVIVDSRHVGQHLSDHPGVPFVLRVRDGFSMDDILLRKTPKNEAVVSAYKKDHSGPVGSGLLELVGFSRIDKYIEKDPAYKKAKAANGGKDPFSPLGQPHFELDFVYMFGRDHVTVVVDLVRPISEPGEVKLNSADPLVQPSINLNFFADDLDIIAMREGIRFCYDILTKGDGFKDLVVDEYPWAMPLGSDDEMKRAVLDRCQTAFHPCGTGAVDAKLKVHGIKNLRVADASIIPIIPDCRIQNSVYMIGEKAADMIKADHKDLFK
ncbi:hypothetical protein VE01_02467 [Pseudogymnoascus verrucosus]|uniref:Glucose-methanol-choline oxidoreductase N-terminal domain-containing protein n=1 Tax=Pseudogymnoascus verrucosus TaxID=342668 RepID=A0A1B8GSV5_9PEZI|nr:uncharacterized protein VE01_02467 [Pseudogymnoascus verrucosus]OBT98919.1 hypothetical protein VE01_02467 [Pseudogymnoascus verrucosus]